MPRYFDRSGRQVSAAEALIGGEVLRDGYSTSSTLRDGERASFDAAFMDTAQRTSLFLTDTGKPVTLADARMADELAFQQSIADHNAWRYAADAPNQKPAASAQPAPVTDAATIDEEAYQQAVNDHNAWRQGSQAAGTGAPAKSLWL